MTEPHPLHLAIGLEGAGWHPAAWRDHRSRAAELFDPGYWSDLVTEADRGGVELVTLADELKLQSHDPRRPDRRRDEVRGRLDAVLVANFLAPITDSVGLAPTITTAHTEPFHAAKAIATLDHICTGRGAAVLRVGHGSTEAAHFGRRLDPREGELDREAVDFAEVQRLLWDSWEDDAEIRDVATGRFIDRDRLHHIDFVGSTFSVKGPSITPRPPQGHPVLAAEDDDRKGFDELARGLDLVFTHPGDQAGVRHQLTRFAGGAFPTHIEKTGETAPRVFADLVVLLEPSETEARAELARLDAWNGERWTPSAALLAGSPSQIADRLAEWGAAGLDGVRLLPARLPRDLHQITETLLPLLAARDLHDPQPAGSTLRERLGLWRPVNRFASTAA